MPVKKVHIVFKTHLDLGFTNLAAQVLQRYLDQFIPSALTLARTLREEGRPERFIWTTGSLLIVEALERGNRAQRHQIEHAIAHADIAWHALPCTTHTELMDASMFEYGLSLSAGLDRRFGRRTISAKMTDVTGHTRAIVPLLAAAGVRFLHIGVNPASAMPDVPRVFRWRHEGAEIVVAYDGDYGATLTVPGLDAALVVAFTGDNHGPQTPQDVGAIFARYRAQFPKAQVSAARLDDFAEPLWKIRARLPVVTQEIGDTWIRGLASDPVKTAHYLALQRLRRASLQQLSKPQHEILSRNLLLVAEHTWGMDIKTHLRDFRRYTGKDFTRLRASSAGRAVESSWREQRTYISAAVAGFGKSALAGQARRAIAPIQRFARTGVRPHNPRLPMRLGKFFLAIDPHSGAISALQHGKRAWAGAQHPLAWVRYQTFDAHDYDRYLKEYARDVDRHGSWIIPDITKPGIEKTYAQSRWWLPHLESIAASPDRALCHITFPAAAVERSGAPRRLELEITARADALSLDLRWFQKKACRLPEALWCSFIPPVRRDGSSEFMKMGSPLDPRDVVAGSTRYLHAVESATYQDEQGRLTIRPMDTPVVSPGLPRLLRHTNDQPQPSAGIHFNLFNNTWGTNFRMWQSDNARARWLLMAR